MDLRFTRYLLGHLHSYTLDRYMYTSRGEKRNTHKKMIFYENLWTYIFQVQFTIFFTNWNIFWFEIFPQNLFLMHDYLILSKLLLANYDFVETEHLSRFISDFKLTTTVKNNISLKTRIGTNRSLGHFCIFFYSQMTPAPEPVSHISWILLLP